MARLPRCTPENSIVEVMMRTIDGRHLVTPIDELNDRIHGVLARSIALSGIKIHGWIYLSNHVHILVSTEDARQLAGFLRHLNRNVTIAIQRVTGHKGRVWEARPHVVAVLDDVAAERRLRYLLSNGVKEGLVDSPLEWPGASSARALLEGTTIRATWVRYDLLTRARRHAKDVDPSRYTETYELEVTPLPSWAGLSPEARRQRARELIDDVILEARVARHGAPSLGVDKIRAQDSSIAHPIEPTPTPVAHASEAGAVAEFSAMRRAYTTEYRRASARYRNGEEGVEFPPGAFRPSGKFTPAAPYRRISGVSPVDG